MAKRAQPIREVKFLPAPSFTLEEGVASLVAKVRETDRALDELQGLIALKREHALMVLSDITLLTKEQLAERLAMSESQIDRAVEEGALTAIRLDRRPRYATEDIKAYISSRRKEKRRRTP